MARPGVLPSKRNLSHNRAGTRVPPPCASRRVGAFVRRIWPFASEALGILLLVAAICGVIAVFLCLGACAVGRNESTGEIVIGVGAGKLVETGNQAIGAAAGALFGPTGVAVSGGALGLLGLLGKFWRDAAAQKARREGEAHGWDEAARTYSPPPPNTPKAPEAG